MRPKFPSAGVTFVFLEEMRLVPVVETMRTRDRIVDKFGETRDDAVREEALTTSDRRNQNIGRRILGGSELIPRGPRTRPEEWKKLEVCLTCKSNILIGVEG